MIIIVLVYLLIGIAFCAGAIHLGRKSEKPSLAILFGCLILLPLWFPMLVYGTLDMMLGKEEP